MKTVFIVDDEYLVLDWLTQTIDWSSFGNAIIGQANNGKEAFEKIRALNPDIVITDIRMPIMDGIELTKQIKSIYPLTKIIILSGYNEFNYAQLAIKHGAVDYLLKPIDNESVISVINKVNIIIDKERNEKEEKKRLMKQVEDNLPVLREKFMNECLLGIDNNMNTVEKHMEFFSIDMESIFRVLILDINNYETMIQGFDEIKRLMFNYEVKNVCNRNLNKIGLMNFFVISNKREIVCILNDKTLDSNETLYGICEDIKKILNEDLKVSVTIGVSNSSDIYGLNKIYEETHKAIKYKLVKGPNSIIYVSDITVYKNVFLYPIEDEKRIINAISNCEIEVMKERIQEFFSFLVKQNYNTITFLKTACFQLITVISRIIYEIDGTMEEVFGLTFNPLYELEKIETTQKFKEYIETISLVIIEYIQSKKSIKTNYIINRALQYINDNIDRDISVYNVASYIGISNNYFSQIFRQTSGEGFKDYVTLLKVNKAKKLLKNKDLKIYEICEKIGYNDQKYFSQVFKRIVGMTPNEYRNNE